MVSTLISEQVIASNSYVDIIAILLLLTLLVVKEFARAAAGDRAARLTQALTISIGPLLLACGVIMTIRFIEILR